MNSLSRQGEAFIEKSDAGKTPCSVARSHLFREYFRENELIKETILTCLSGAQVGWIKEIKNAKTSRDTATVPRIKIFSKLISMSL